MKDLQRIKKDDKKKVNELNYDGVEFPVSQRHYNKVEKQNNIRINVFGYEDGQPFPISISKETFEDQMNLLLITKDEKTLMHSCITNQNIRKGSTSACIVYNASQVLKY